MARHRRVLEIRYYGGGPNPIPDPFSCRHEWEAPRDREGDGYCPKCKHCFYWMDDTRGKPLEWWKKRREANDEERAKPRTVSLGVK